MSKFYRAVVLTAVAVGSIAAAEPRTPTARWVVNYDDAQCVASRNYGTEEQPLHLALKPSPTGSVLRIMLIRKGASADADQIPATLRFDGNPPIRLKALSYGDRETKRFMASINLPMAIFAANRQAKSIAIKSGRFDERLAVPGMSGVAAAFDDLANLRKVWNVGQPQAPGLKQSAQPIRPLGRLFSSGDYPARAIQEDNTGRVGLAMLIDEAGKVRDCMVEETSDYATLDTMSCYVITSNAKFTPAIGVDDKPAKSAYLQRISWLIRP